MRFSLLIEVPRKIVTSIENVMSVAPGRTGRTHFPEATMVAAPGDSNSAQASGSEPEPQRGQIAWT